MYAVTLLSLYPSMYASINEGSELRGSYAKQKKIRLPRMAMHYSRSFQKSQRVPNACIPAVIPVSIQVCMRSRGGGHIPLRQPCIISSFPCLLDVINITSAPKLSHVSWRSFMVSGRPPRFLESQRIILSGSMCLWIRPVIVGPKVFS